MATRKSGQIKAATAAAPLELLGAPQSGKQLGNSAGKSLTHKPPNRRNGLAIRWRRRSGNPEVRCDVAHAEADVPPELVMRDDTGARGVLQPASGHAQLCSRLVGVEQWLNRCASGGGRSGHRLNASGERRVKRVPAHRQPTAVSQRYKHTVGHGITPSGRGQCRSTSASSAGTPGPADFHRARGGTVPRMAYGLFPTVSY